MPASRMSPVTHEISLGLTGTIFFQKVFKLFFKKNACLQNGQIWSNILPETTVG